MVGKYVAGGSCLLLSITFCHAFPWGWEDGEYYTNEDVAAVGGDYVPAPEPIYHSIPTQHPFPKKHRETHHEEEYSRHEGQPVKRAQPAQPRPPTSVPFGAPTQPEHFIPGQPGWSPNSPGARPRPVGLPFPQPPEAGQFRGTGGERQQAGVQTQGNAVFQPGAGTPATSRNFVTATPNVVCRDDRISVSIPTQLPYTGRLYVSGQSHLTSCIAHYYGTTDRPMIEIPISGCEMSIERITDPVLGVEYTAPIVVSFHTELLTESDRLFHVKCRYMSTDKTMASFYEVGALPTEIITSVFASPVCKYTLHLNSDTGPTAGLARIGDAVFHKWACDSESHALKVRNCYVDDGISRRYQIIDEYGCPRDRTILPDLYYDQTMTSATVKTHVFKFADQPHVYFKCEITLCVKGEESCLRSTPPQCAINTAPINGQDKQQTFGHVIPSDVGEYYTRFDSPSITIREEGKPYQALLHHDKNDRLQVMRDFSLHHAPHNNTTAQSMDINSGGAQSISDVSQNNDSVNEEQIPINTPSLFVVELGDEEKLKEYVRETERQSGLSPRIAPVPDNDSKWCLSDFSLGALFISNLITLALTLLFGCILYQRSKMIKLPQLGIR